jgi:hypothetical protein
MSWLGRGKRDDKLKAAKLVQKRVENGKVSTNDTLEKAEEIRIT